MSLHVQPIFTREPSGTVHIRYELGERFLVDERCIHARCGGFDIVDAATVEQAEPDQLCRICWPPHNGKARR
jgi:hypothetical protein